MVKKALNPLHIDYKRCIVEDRLLQIRNRENFHEPDLSSVWTVEINARDSKVVVDCIRRKFQPNDPVTFTHVKRIRKKVEEKKKLIVIICSCELFNDKSEVASRLDDSEVPYDRLSNENVIPRQAAPTKEIMIQWSDKFWPLTWCGNPNDQILNDYLFDMTLIKKVLGKITALSREALDNGNKYPIVTAFVDLRNKEDPIYATDSRTKDGCSPLDHSIMCGIKSVAEKERKLGDTSGGGGYLCLDFDVYTTHEPCSMCAMALIHSRIKRCIFLQPMEITGALKPSSGDAYCMHNNRLLNSKYEAFQWIGDEYSAPKLDQNTCC